MEELTSLNPYTKMTAIVAESPEELCEKIRSVLLPIKIVTIAPWYSNRVVAYVTSELTQEQMALASTKPKKPRKVVVNGSTSK
jgi:hypothetical protein